MINGGYKILNEQFLSIIFIADSGIFKNIEHLDLSCAKFKSNLMRMLPSTLKTLRFQRKSFVSFDEIQCISHLVNLTSLSIVECRIHDGSFHKSPVQLPSLQHLTTLRLRNDPIGGAVVSEPMRTDHFSKLTHLDLSDNNIGDAGIQKIMESPYIGNLTILDLSWSCFGNASVILIAKSPYLGNLTQLFLNVNRNIGDEGIIKLTRSTYLRQLTELGLAQTKITSRGLMSIFKSECLTSLSTLDVSFTKFGKCNEALLTALPQCLFTSSITSLDLSYALTDDTLLPMVMNTPLLMNLRTLNLKCGNYHWWDNEHLNYMLTHAEALARSPYIRNITNLNLSSNDIKEDWLEVLANSSNFSKLTTLNLSCNHIDRGGLRFLLESPYLSSLTDLDLACNKIRERGATDLAYYSDLLGQLKHLNVLHNRIPRDTLQELREYKLRKGYKDLELELKSPRRSDSDSE